MRRVTLALFVLLAVGAAACAPSVKPAPAPGALRYPEFVYPAPLAGAADSRVDARHQTAWGMLQAGDLKLAEAEFAGLAARHPGYYPASVGWGYALVAAGRASEALARFDRAIRLAPRYAPALAGRAEALLAEGRRDEALAGFEAALASDSTLDELRRRIDVLRFSGISERIAAARQAEDAGRLDEARRAYEAALGASPDSAFLHRDLGLLELRRRDLESAERHLTRAAALDPSDAGTRLGLADLFEAREDWTAAAAELERAYELDRSEPVARRLEKVRAHETTRRLPPEYAAIATAPEVTRGDLAALLGVRLGAALAGARGRAGIVATDVRGHWASTWVLSVIRAGVMDVYPNHTFQPRSAVRRADLAQAVSRVLGLARPSSAPPRPRPPIADVGPDHLRYADVAAAVAAGVMTLDGGLFRPSRVVSGAEALEVVRRLERAVPPAAGAGR